VLLLVGLFFVLLRRATPFRVVAVAQALAHLVWIGSSYPDNLTAFVQAMLVSSLLLFVGGRAIRLWSPAPGPAGGSTYGDDLNHHPQRLGRT